MDLNLIIEKHKLDPDLLAKELFPNNKYPKIALDRVCNGVTHLDTEQAYTLSKLLGIDISELYNSEHWGASMVHDKIVFKRNNYKIVLHTETYLTDIYVNGKLTATEKLIIDKNIKLSEYLKLVESILINLI